jgi:hypothetical protein
MYVHLTYVRTCNVTVVTQMNKINKHGMFDLGYHLDQKSHA